MTTATRPDEQATLPGIASKFKPSIPIRARYDNWIGGEYRPPERGQYFTNPSPVTGQPLCEVARSTQEDIDKALDAAHAAAVSWNTTSATYRAIILNKIADRLEENLDHPLGPMLYACSCLHCMTVSLSQGGEGLGTMWGEQTARAYLKQAGFGQVELRRLTGDPMHAFYVARPWQDDALPESDSLPELNP